MGQSLNPQSSRSIVPDDHVFNLRFIRPTALFAERGACARLLVVLAATVVYALSFGPAYRALGPIVGSLGVLPVALWAWVGRLPGGLLAGLLSVPVNAMLFASVGAELTTLVRAWPGFLVELLVGIVIGWLNDAVSVLEESAVTIEGERAALSAKVDEFEQVEDLVRARDSLEQRVRERTVDLANANVILRAQIEERRRVEEELRKNAAKLTTVHALGQAVVAQVEPEEVMRMAVERGRSLLQASMGLVAMKEADGGLSYTAAEGPNARLFRRRKLAPGSLQERVVRSGRPLLTNDPLAEGVGDRQLAAEIALRALAAAPIRCLDEVPGCLTVLRTESQPPFTQEDLILLETFADYVSLAMEHAQLYEHLRERADRDSLTDLYNRRVLMEHLDREAARGSRSGRAFCVLMMDIDAFKMVNDTHGHLAGDAVLQELARRLRSGARDSDIVGRYGGEEFLIILTDTDEPGAIAAAQRMHDIVSRSAYALPDYGQVEIEVSIGVAVYPRDGDDRETLIGAADRACYTAKHRGGGQTVVADRVGRFPDDAERVRAALSQECGA